MADNQIQIRWARYSGENYEFTAQAMESFRPRPNVAMSISLKGSNYMPESALAQINRIAMEHGFKMVTVLTGTWPEDDAPQNLRIAPQTAEMFSDEDFRGVIAEGERIEAGWQTAVGCEHTEVVTDPGSLKKYCRICGSELPDEESADVL